MDEKKIARINALAKKARTPEGLTPAEKEEQNALRTEYRQSVVGNLKGQLNNTVVIRRTVLPIARQTKRSPSKDCLCAVLPRLLQPELTGQKVAEPMDAVCQDHREIRRAELRQHL